MPRVKPLTEAQAEAEKAAKRRETLAECVSFYKAKTGKTDEQVSKELGITTRSLRKIKGREKAPLDISTTVRLLAAGGYEITRKAETL